jgi:hypothetical protein
MRLEWNMEVERQSAQIAEIYGWEYVLKLWRRMLLEDKLPKGIFVDPERD